MNLITTPTGRRTLERVANCKSAVEAAQRDMLLGERDSKTLMEFGSQLSTIDDALNAWEVDSSTDVSRCDDALAEINEYCVTIESGLTLLKEANQ